jgi:cytochrome P450
MSTAASLHVEIPPPPDGFDLYPDAVHHDPYPHYRWLLRHDPVHHGAGGTWFIAPYDLVQHVMSAPLFDRDAGFREVWKTMVGPGPLSDIMGLTLFFAGPADHARQRRLIQCAFRPRLIDALTPRIGQVVDELLEPALERGQMDVIADFAYPLPLMVLGELLGFPAEDREQLRSWSVAIEPTVDFSVTPEVARLGNAAMGEFVGYVRDLLPALARQECLLGELAAATGEGLITEDELVSMAITLILAGHETTTGLIGNGLLALMRHPDQLGLLRRDPGLILTAVEECLRYDAPVQSNPREVQQDTRLGGKTLRQGDMAVVLQGAANRDPAQFPDPDRFDITRTGTHPISFGAGPRRCLGAPLARLEARIALGALARRTHDIQLAGPGHELRYQPSSMFRVLNSVPVTL